MALILPAFQQKVSLITKTAANKAAAAAFDAAMNNPFPGGTAFQADLGNRTQIFAAKFAMEFDLNFSIQIATEIDLYIRSATITLPPGQAVLAGAYAGATVAPSPPALIS